MRNLGHLDDADLAQDLSDALYARGIANDVRPDDGGVTLWVHDDARLPEARAALAAFRDAGGAGFDGEIAAGRAHRRDLARKDEAYRARLVHAKRAIHGADGHGWVTIVVGVLALAVAGIGRVGADVARLQPLFLTLAPAGLGLPEVASGQVWRLFTPILVHFGVLHLIFNLSAWSTFARQVEQRKGAAFMTLFVLTTAASSNLAEAAWGLVSSPERVHLVGGLSGVIYGLFGFVWTKGRIDPLDRLGIDEGTTRMLMLWLLLGFTGALGPIANVAHLSGLVWGALYAVLDVGLFRLRKRRR